MKNILLLFFMLPSAMYAQLVTRPVSGKIPASCYVSNNPSNDTKPDPKQRHTATQLKFDFLVLRESLEEGHPGLYDYISGQRMDSLFDDAFSKIEEGMSTLEFYKLLSPLISQIRDGHTDLSSVPNPAPTPVLLPHATFSLFDDTLRVSRVSSQADLKLIGKEIKAIDGINAGKLIPRFKKICEDRILTKQEGFIESMPDLNHGTFFYIYYIENYPLKDEGITLTFADGTKQTFPLTSSDVGFPLLPRVKYYTLPYADVIYQKIDGKTALLDINTFGMHDADRDSIGSFIRDIEEQKYENLIIDVRYNRGGGFGDLFSYIADRPFQVFTGFKVNQNDTYDFFRHCSNFTPDDRTMFPEYIKNEEMGGYYLLKDSLELSYPSDSIHFSGRVYVLTDERTFSAASVFAGLVHKYKRGVTIGRETGSAYHQINASKYAKVVLEHSRLSIRIPLVKCIFDYPENSDIPWGRGVLPDYPFAFSINELINGESVMLDYALRLIKENKYIKTDTTSIRETVQHNSGGKTFPLIICLIAVIVIFLISFNRIRSSKRETQQE